jgi:penicillin-binding protein 2
VIAELRNVEQELERFRVRLIVAGGFVLFCFALLASRLIHLQVLSHEELATQAENNRIAVVPIVPNRGLIVDRNGVVLADQLLGLHAGDHARPSSPTAWRWCSTSSPRWWRSSPATVGGFKRLMEDSRASSRCPFAPSSPMKRSPASPPSATAFPEWRSRRGCSAITRYGELASHVLGYIGRINQAEKTAMEEWPEEDWANYRGTEYIGKLGLEQSTSANCTASRGLNRWRPVPAAGRCAA